MMQLVSIKISETEYKHFKVCKEVYAYILQLENCIRYPDVSQLKEVYPERFSNENSQTPQ